MRGTEREIKIRDSCSQPATEWRGSRAYVLLGVSLGCHFSHTTPFLRQHHPSPPTHSWSDSFLDHRNSSYDVCGGRHYSSAHENNGPAAEPETGFSVAEKFCALLHRFQVAYLIEVLGRYVYQSAQWAREILVLYKIGDLLTRSAPINISFHTQRTLGKGNPGSVQDWGLIGKISDYQFLFPYTIKFH